MGCVRGRVGLLSNRRRCVLALASSGWSA